ncbi:MAG: ATP-dependent zinc metalloprotease FtsH [Actinobacteria bacterium]|nr:ATP-dependent zinc metalloprotease FtsH [Actinomycetota bacterium]
MELDTSWINSALEKRQSNYSSVICFESNDPVRLKQLRQYLASHEDYKRVEVYSFDPWKGLETEVRGRRIPVTESKTKEWDPSQAYPIASVDAALTHMDGKLKRNKTLFLLLNLDILRSGQLPDERQRTLWACLQSWALDSEILASGSCVFLISEDASLVLDEATLNLCVFQKVPPPSDKERLQLIDRLSAECGVKLTYPIETLVIATRGLTLYQLEGILLESYHATGTFDIKRIKQLKTEFIQRSELVEIVEPEWGFERIGGYEAVKKFVTENIINCIKDPARAQKFGVPLPRGVILFGPPGTGKTLFARALAKEANLPFINLKTENLYGMYLGETGRRFSEAIRLSEQHSPAIVFVDEMDKFGQRRGTAADGASEETRRALNQLLEWLGDQNRKSIIVGTTNRIEDLDPALKRAGRFDYKIPLLYPGEKARRRILEIHLGIDRDNQGRLLKGRNTPPLGMNDAALEKVLDELTQMTRGYSGAELELLVIRARRIAFNDRNANYMTSDHLMKAFRDYTIEESDRKGEIEFYYKQAESNTDSQAFLEELRKDM